MSQKAQITEDDRIFLKTYSAEDYDRPSVTVDILIFTTDPDGLLNLLMIKRKFPPFAGCWALPGGFLNMDESLEDAAARELMEETGVSGIHMEQLCTTGTVDRDPRTRVVSVAYIAMVPNGTITASAGDDAAETEWFTVYDGDDGIPVLKRKKFPHREDGVMIAFDHEDIIKTAVERMRGKIGYTPIAFEFLNNKGDFTISELRKIHEAVLGRKLDIPNFRRSFINNHVRKGHAVENGKTRREYPNRAARCYRYCGTNPADAGIP